MDFLACVDNNFRTGPRVNEVPNCNRVLHVNQKQTKNAVTKNAVDKKCSDKKMQWQNAKHFEEKKRNGRIILVPHKYVNLSPHINWLFYVLCLQCENEILSVLYCHHYKT